MLVTIVEYENGQKSKHEDGEESRLPMNANELTRSVGYGHRGIVSPYSGKIARSCDGGVIVWKGAMRVLESRIGQSLRESRSIHDVNR